MRRVNMFAVALGLAVSGASPALAQGGEQKHFTLHSAINNNLCLEGNETSSKEMDGAAFLRPCVPQSGQMWRAVPVDNGSFYLKNAFKGDELCLDGNSDGRPPRGAAFMGPCGAPSTKWRATANNRGGFQLRNGRYGNTKCLEGNRVARGAAAGGASLMWDCANVSGQQWTVRGGSLVNGIPQAD